MALLIDANNELIDRGSDSGLDDKTAFTWILIFKRNGDVQEGAYCQKGTAGNQKYVASVFNDHADVEFGVNRATTAASCASTGNIIPLDTFKFLAVTYDESDGPRIFHATLPGAIVETSYDYRNVGSGATNADNGASFRVGDSSVGGQPADVNASRFLWFDRRMTLAELRRIYLKAVNDSDALLWWELGYNGTGTQADYSGNGRTGTVSGATVTDHAPLPPPFGFDLPILVIPAATTAQSVSLGSARLVVRAPAQTVATAVSVSVGTPTVAIRAVAPAELTVDQSVALGSPQLAVRAESVTPAATRAVSLDAARYVLRPVSVTTATAVSVALGTPQVALQVPAATVATAASVDLASGQLVLRAVSVTPSLAGAQSVDLGVARLAVQAPAVTPATGERSVDLDPAVLTLRAQAVTVGTAQAVNVGTAALVLRTPAASITLGALALDTGVGRLVLAAPSVSITTTRALTLGVTVLVVKSPGVTPSVAGAQSITLGSSRLALRALALDAAAFSIDLTPPLTVAYTSTARPRRRPIRQPQRQ